MNKWMLLACVSLFTSILYAQPAYDEICKNRLLSVSNYRAYPGPVQHQLTPAPRGYKPFYISHYGRHGSRYISRRMGYDIPYNMMCRADSMGLLTLIGNEVLKQITSILEDSEMRWGDLTSYGHYQIRQISAR